MSSAVEEVSCIGANKTALLHFLVNEWSRDEYHDKLKQTQLYATVEGKCFNLHANEEHSVTVQEIPELETTQEEADSRIFLHAKHASDQGHPRVVIRSCDTDVEVLALYQQEHIESHIIVHSGTKQASRIVSIPDVRSSLGDNVCSALPGLHAFTGCDSVSAFAGKGKCKALSKHKK